MKKFVINQQLKPSGDQPKAIEALCQGLRRGCHSQVLLGVTGSGKTFTMANVIARENRPALILAPNKTLAAQLYGEMKAMFPENAVEYFVSYYDYYRPEAYVPSSDTFIEKDSAVNEQIEQLRLGATKSLLERNDVVVVASVSAIYGLGDPTMYKNSSLLFEVHNHYSMPDLMRDLAKLQYRRNRLGLARGDFYVTGEIIDIFPAEEDKTVIRLSFFGDMLESIVRIDPLTGEIQKELAAYTLYPRTHYVTAEEETAKAIPAIKQEMQQVYQQFLEEGKFVEAQRIKQRTEMDLEMLKEVGFCYGIENYSRFFCNQQPGEPPPTLFEYFPSNGLLFIDESHVTLPQIKAMYRGDVARKSTLVTHGFRLPSALDNRPLKFEEFETLRPETIFVSATPAAYELQQAQGAIVEQVVRPTGLLDPEIEVRPTKNQIIDLCAEILWRREKNERICVLTLTKRMAEDLTHYLIDQGIKTQYLHSGIDTIERVEILNNLRLGNIEVLVGINLLREGLDLPEVSLIAILDADKEGFLRSSPALIQMIGRAARHLSGRAILYADKITPSMQEAMDETTRRRLTQMAYNERHGHSPTAVTRSIRPSLQEEVQSRSAPVEETKERYTQAEIIALQEKMRRHAELLEFEQALKIQQQLKAAQINYSASDKTSKTRRKTVLPAKSRRARSIQTPPDEKR